MTTTETTRGPPSSIASMLSAAGIHNPMDTSTATLATTTATTAQNVAASAQTTAQNGATTASQIDPLANLSAGTALTSATSSADAANSENGEGGRPVSAQPSGGMTSGAKIGIGVGVGIGVAVLIALIAVFFMMRRRRKSRYNTGESAEQMRGQPGMTSTEPALAGASALGRSLSYRSTTSYHSLAPMSPPPVPETAADPMPEATKGIIPVTPIIIPPSQQTSPLAPHEAQTPGSRRSMEAEVITSPGNETPFSPAPPMYVQTASPVEEPPSRPISPVSPISPMGSRPPSLRRSIDS